MRRLIHEEPVSRAGRWSRQLALFALAVIGLTLAIARGDGVARLALLYVLAAAVLVALAAALAALVAFRAIWRDGRRGLGPALTGLVLSLAVLAWPAWLAGVAATLPRINDVSTDLDQRPDFSRSREALRARDGRTPPDAPPAFRDLQLAAYPGLAPIVLERSAEEAFDIARQAARQLGWRIADEVAPGGRAGAGRFDAVSRTWLLRFADDVTVRVRPQAAGARIDVRSASRVGRHDFGVNARRIQQFADLVRAIEDER